MDEVQERTDEGKPENSKAAFLSRMKKDLAGPKDAMTSESIYGSKPIADLFPDVTIMFADIVGKLRCRGFASIVYPCVKNSSKSLLFPALSFR